MINLQQIIVGPDGRLTREGYLMLQSLVSTGGGTGDMTKAVYDADNDGVVDNAEGMGGQPPSYYLDRANHTGTQTAATISDLSEAVDDRVAALLVAGSNISLTYNDGANTLTVASTGGAGNGGTATLNFGAAPGTNVATVTVTGQTTLLAGSRIKAWVAGQTASHNAYEHATILPLAVSLAISDVIAGTGFTIYGTTDLRLAGTVAVAWEWA